MNNELQNLINKQNEQIQQLLEVNSELQQQNEQLMEQNKIWEEQFRIQDDILMAYHNYDYSTNELSQTLTTRNKQLIDLIGWSIAQND
jgi:mevalonate kinase